MNSKFIKISSSLLIVILGVATSVLSAATEILRPFVPLAVVVIIVGGGLFIFFSVADTIEFRCRFCLLLFGGNRLNEIQRSFAKAEAELGHDPELDNADVSNILNLLKSWERDGKDLRIMSWRYSEARRLLVDLTSLIAPAMLRHASLPDEISLLDKFINLGSTAYKRAKRSSRWNKAAMITYYMTYAYYSKYTNLIANDGRRWVDRMREIYNDHREEELHAFLLEIEGLLFKDDQDRRPDAEQSFKDALHIAQSGNLATKPNITKMTKNVYFYLGELAEQETDAISYYSQALDSASKDLSKQLKIYNKLAELAYKIGDYPQANQWYREQLNLAESNKSPVWQGYAHQGLAKVLFEQPQPDVEQAYPHAKQALEFVIEQVEDNREEFESEERKVRELFFKVTYKMYEEYRSLRQGLPVTLPGVSLPPQTT